MEIVHSAMVVPESSPLVEVETGEFENTDPDAEKHLSSIGTEADAPQSLRKEDKTGDSG